MGLRLDLLTSKVLVNLVGYRMTDTDRPVSFGVFVNTSQKAEGFDLKVDYVPLRHLQLNVANVADDDKFYGATWQVGRTYRLSATVNF